NGAGQVAALVEDVNALAEGAVALDAGAALVPVTDLNPARQTRVERLSLQREGFTVEGWLMFPAGFEPGARFPLIHSIHGGPATTVGGAFTFEHQFLAGHGYAVLLGNIRGSAGYGPAQTAGILGTYGLGDADDLTALLDAVLERYAWIDPQRVAAVGGSYGGFMVNWLSGHSDRYACAITERSICNWVSFWGTSDIGFNFATREHGTASVTADAEALWERSPLKYVDRVKLPTLIIHSEEDHRCPIEQAEQWFVALRQRGVPVRFVRFPDESHDLSRSGRPDRRVARLGEILGWLDAHLKAGEPDTAPGEGR
ncbi:MAG TPA: S9 family peptidase, partial [Deinococcales bacterium]|nr:S9 family peptidase [Deinococcales bacterium]